MEPAGRVIVCALSRACASCVGTHQKRTHGGQQHPSHGALSHRPLKKKTAEKSGEKVSSGGERGLEKGGGVLRGGHNSRRSQGLNLSEHDQKLGER